jgi:Tat protein translocase TatB subunit
MEILAVLVVALVVFGPHRLPELARNVGKTISQLKRTAEDLRSEFEAGFDFDDDDDEAAHDIDDDSSPRSGEVRARSSEPPEVIPDKDNLEERAKADEQRVTDTSNGPGFDDGRATSEPIPEVKGSSSRSVAGPDEP